MIHLSGQSTLMLDKVLMSPYRQSPRGVEVFNLNLLRDLSSMGMEVAAAMHFTWLAVAEEWMSGNRVEFLVPPPGFGDLRTALWLTRRLCGRTFSSLLLAYVANRLVPVLILLRMARVAPMCVLIAHREPTRRNLYVQKLWPSRISAVNRKIAGHFVRMGFPHVSVRYGITNAECFHPTERREHGGMIDFCVTGHLDSAWKGSDTAVDAFCSLPDDVRCCCRLHLASFHKPPIFDDPNIVVYPWMDFKEMPAFLRRMDVLVVPSRDEVVMRETFSQAMVQGMLTGLPCIVSNLPVLEEKLDCGGGVVFRDKFELTAAMAKLAGDAGLRHRMGEEARRTALERYVWNTGDFARDFLMAKYAE